jgi:hypothetical protein
MVTPLLPYTDTLMLTRGALRNYINPTIDVPIVLRVSGGTSILGTLSDEEITTSIKEALRLNVAAIAVSIFVGSEHEKQTLLNLSCLVTEGEEYGIPVLAVTAVGKEMARALSVTIGDTLKVLYPMGRLTPMGMTASGKTLRVAAIFQSGLWDIDANWAYVNIDTARRLFIFPEGSALALQFKTDDLENAQTIADSIRVKAGPGFFTSTWIELNKPLFSALKLEKLILFLTIGLIVFVASLNIVTTLIMMVLDKQGISPFLQPWEQRPKRFSGFHAAGTDYRTFRNCHRRHPRHGH